MNKDKNDHRLALSAIWKELLEREKKRERERERVRDSFGHIIHGLPIFYSKD